MTTAIAVAAVVAASFAFGSLIRYVDGATLRRWRLSRGWDVSRLAREFIAAADEPLATVQGLTHMINAWERGARRPSERYWLLYLKVLPECVTGGPDETGEPPAVPGTGATQADGSARAASPDEVRALAATVRALEQQVAGLAQRLDKLSRGQHGDRQPPAASERAKTRSRYRRSNWTPLWTVLLPSSSSVTR